MFMVCVLHWYFKGVYTYVVGSHWYVDCVTALSPVSVEADLHARVCSGPSRALTSLTEMTTLSPTLAVMRMRNHPLPLC